MALSPLKNKQIEAFHDKGLTVKEIGRKTHCSHAEIRQLLKSKGKEPIEEKKPTKENEPASAATDTSSMDVKQIESSGTVSASKYTIAVRKSQAQRALDITKKTLKDIYEYMNEAEQRAFDLGEAFGRICTAIEEEEE